MANHWRCELQSSLDAASQKLNEQLARVSQAIIEQAEHDITARNSSLRIAFDDATAGAQKTIEEIKATVAQEQLRAEATKAEIQNVARMTLDETRQQVEQLTSSHLAEIGRLADYSHQRHIRLILIGPSKLPLFALQGRSYGSELPPSKVLGAGSVFPPLPRLGGCETVESRL